MTSDSVGFSQIRPQDLSSHDENLRSDLNLNEPEIAKSPLHQYILTWVLVAFSCTWVIFTIIFAYNCTLDHPIFDSLVLATPARTILVLSILSQFTIFFVGELMTTAFEALRWAFACSQNGMSAFSFLILGRATGLLGVLGLLFRWDQIEHDGLKQNHRLWGSQSLLGFILLSEISIKSTYHDILTFGLQTAGLTPINATLAEDDITRLVFWYNLPNFIPNSKYVVPIDPISCSGSGCNAYFAPGGLEDILLENYTNPEIPLEYYPEADSYLQKDAPGYQIEFDSSVAGLELSVDDCRVYGTQDLAIAVCIKSDKDSIVMGWNPCPEEISRQCLTDISWIGVGFMFATRVAFIKRHATTAFSRLNYTILDVVPSASWTPASYSPEDFFTIFGSVFSFNQTETNFKQFLDYQFFEFLWAELLTNAEAGTSDRREAGLQRIQQFVAACVVELNNAAWYNTGDPTAEDSGKFASLAKRGYRLVISSYSLWLFVGGTAITIFWSICILFACMFFRIPNSSVFPEVNFASRICPHDYQNAADPNNVCVMFYDMSNKGTRSVETALKGKRFYVGDVSHAAEVGHIGMGLKVGNAAKIRKNKLYL